MKYAFVAAALAGSVFASQHKAHAGFHQRRHEYPVAPQDDVCTVYTTVYVTPEHPAPHYPTATPETPKPSVPQQSKPVVSESTSCSEDTPKPTGPASVPQPSQPGYPVVPQSQPPVPQQSQPGYPTGPQPSQPAVPQESKPAVPESTSCTEETPKPTGPAPVPQPSQPGYPVGPQPSQPGYPVVPQSQPPVPQQSQPGYPTGPQPSQPAVPQESKPAVPESTSCTEETPKPTGPAPVPQQSQPGYPVVPQPSQPSQPETPKPNQPGYPTVPQTPKESKPSQPETPKPNQPGYPTVPEQGKPTPSHGSDKPKPSAPTGGNGRIVTNGDKWAITYTPYASSGQCKTKEDIVADIQKISDLGFTTIRLYSTDCFVFDYVVPECQKHGLKAIYGIFLEAGGKGCFSQHADEQLQEIKNKAPKDSVAMVIVGNECMFNGNCQPEELASYIDHVRQELQGAGFPKDIAITTTEPVNVWEEKGAALCDHIDVFVAQVQPYFTQSVSSDMAGDFAAQQLDQAAKVCPGAAAKGKYIGEIGWPSSGASNGKANATPEDQKKAIKSILDKVGSQACMFHFQDDAWKPAGEYGVEQHFGCVDALSS